MNVNKSEEEEKIYEVIFDKSVFVEIDFSEHRKLFLLGPARGTDVFSCVGRALAMG
jgi:predicted RNA-binding protein with PUA domain